MLNRIYQLSMHAHTDIQSITITCIYNIQRLKEEPFMSFNQIA